MSNRTCGPGFFWTKRDCRQGGSFHGADGRECRKRHEAIAERLRFANHRVDREGCASCDADAHELTSRARHDPTSIERHDAVPLKRLIDLVRAGVCMPARRHARLTMAL